MTLNRRNLRQTGSKYSTRMFQPFRIVLLLALYLSLIISPVRASWSTYYTSDKLHAYSLLSDNTLLSVGPANESPLKISKIASPPLNASIVITNDDKLVAFYGSSFCKPLKLSQYSPESDSWNEINFDAPNTVPRYLESSIYIAYPDSDLIYIYGGRNLTNSCANRVIDYPVTHTSTDVDQVIRSTFVSSDTYVYNTTSREFSKITTVSTPTEMFGAGVFPISSTSSIIVGGKASRGWVGTNQLALWQYSSWTFVSTTNSEKVDSRTYPLLLPLKYPVGSSESSFSAEDSGLDVTNLIVLGGSVNGHDALPYAAGLSLNETTGWTWNSSLSQSIFNNAPESILGAVTFGNTLATFSSSNEPNAKENEVIDLSKRDGDSNINVQFIDTESWKEVPSYVPKVDTSSPQKPVATTTVTIDSERPSSTSTSDDEKKKNEDKGASDSSIPTSGKIALSTVLPVSAIAAVLVGFFIYRKWKTKRDELNAPRPLMPLSPYLGSFTSPSRDSFSLALDPSVERQDSINSWEEKRRKYENAVGLASPLLPNMMQSTSESQPFPPLPPKKAKGTEGSPFFSFGICNQPYLPVPDNSKKKFGSNESVPSIGGSSTDHSGDANLSSSSFTSSYPDSSPERKPAVTSVTNAVAGYTNDPNYKGFHNRHSSAKYLSPNDEMLYDYNYEKEILATSPGAANILSQVTEGIATIASPPPAAMVSGTRQNNSMLDNGGEYPNNGNLSRASNYYSDGKSSPNKSDRYIGSTGLLNRVSTLVSTIGRERILKRNKKWSMLSSGNGQNNNGDYIPRPQSLSPYGEHQNASLYNPQASLNNRYLNGEDPYNQQIGTGTQLGDVYPYNNQNSYADGDYYDDNDYFDDDDDDEDIFKGRDVQVLVSSRRRTRLRVTNPDPTTPSRTNSDKSTATTSIRKSSINEPCEPLHVSKVRGGKENNSKKPSSRPSSRPGSRAASINSEFTNLPLSPIANSNQRFPSIKSTRSISRYSAINSDDEEDNENETWYDFQPTGSEVDLTNHNSQHNKAVYKDKSEPSPNTTAPSSGAVLNDSENYAHTHQHNHNMNINSHNNKDTINSFAATMKTLSMPNLRSTLSSGIKKSNSVLQSSSSNTNSSSSSSSSSLATHYHSSKSSSSSLAGTKGSIKDDEENPSSSTSKSQQRSRKSYGKLVGRSNTLSGYYMTKPTNRIHGPVQSISTNTWLNGMRVDTNNTHVSQRKTEENVAFAYKQPQHNNTTTKVDMNKKNVAAAIGRSKRDVDAIPEEEEDITNAKFRKEGRAVSSGSSYAYHAV